MLDISTGVFTSYTAGELSLNRQLLVNSKNTDTGVYIINYNVLSWINYGGGEVKMMF